MEVIELLELQETTTIEITALGAVMPAEPIPPPVPKEIAYNLNTEFGDFPVCKTYNGFWLTSTKLEVFLGLIKKGYSVNQALGTIGVLRSSWYHFLELHPGFLDIVEGYEEMSSTPFVDALHSDGAKDLTTVRWLLGKRDSRFKEETKAPPPTEVLQPTKEAPINQVHVEQININANEISGVLAKFAKEFFGADSEVSEAIVHEAMAELPQEGLQ